MKTKLLFVLSVTLIAAPCSRGADEHPAAPATNLAATKAKKVDVEEFDKLRQNKANVVLDVRTEAEFKTAHIPGAVNIDVNGPDFAAKVAKLDKGKTYLVHCAAGRRSASAGAKLTAVGFTNLFDLAPGFKGWEAAGKPTEK